MCHNVLPGLIGHDLFQVCPDLGADMIPVVPLSGNLVRIGQDQPHISGCLHHRLKLRRTCGIVAVGDADHQIAAVCNMRSAPECFIVRVRYDHQMGDAR